MKLGNIPSRLNIRPGNLLKSGLGDAGSFFSDIVNMYKDTQSQKTAVALSQNQTVQAQYAAQIAAANAAASQASAPGMSFQTQLLLAGSAIAGVLYFGKMKKRR